MHCQLEALQDNLKAVFNSQEADALARKEIEIHRLNEAVDMLRAQLKAQERVRARGRGLGTACCPPNERTGHLGGEQAHQSAAATAPLVDVPTDPASGVVRPNAQKSTTRSQDIETACGCPSA